MKKRYIRWAMVCGMGVLLSGCAHTSHQKPRPEEQKSTQGVVMEVDEQSRITLKSNQDRRYVECGEGTRVKCLPFSKDSERRVIGKVTEIKADRPKSTTQSYGDPQCEYVIEIDVDGRIVYFIIDICAHGLK